jgi:hypothetical protein
MEDLQNDYLTHVGLQVDDEVRQQLTSSAKWTKFISIVMFVACGLILIFGIIGGAAMATTFSRFGSSYSMLGNFTGPVLIAIVVVCVAILAVVYYFLYNFSQRITRALIADSSTELNAGLKSLKTFFIITTIFAILSLLTSIYNLFA